MSGPWDAARAASKRSVRKYKPVAPVGAKLLEHPQLGMQRHFGGVYDLRSCAGCGYHVCSCELQSPHVDDSAYEAREQILRRLQEEQARADRELAVWPQRQFNFRSEYTPRNYTRSKLDLAQALMDTPLGSTDREAIMLLITGQPPKDEP